MLSKQPVMHPLFLLVDKVDYYICIGGMAGCEDNYLKVFAESRQNLSSIRSHIDSSLHHITSCGLDGQPDITLISLGVVAVNQCLIKIEY